ncbi:MAG: hypothetical protein LBF90_03985 [Prevotellaceae bacterium]|jgi:hypothetical protein|nr:hypothetical protein [Prevotellaceae bacterium]
MTSTHTLRPAHVSRRRTIVRRILWSLLGLTIFIAAGVSVALYVVFTPARMTPLVLKYANAYLPAQVSCESVDLTFFSTFPYLGVRLQNGSLIAAPGHRPGQPQDTLLLFRELLVSFDPLALYRENRLVVNRARLSAPVVYACVDEEGKANWEALLPSSPEVVATTDSSGAAPFTVEVKSVHIREAHIIYDDRRQALFIATDNLRLHARGTLTDVAVKLDIAAATVLYEDKAYTSKLPLSLSTHLVSDTNYLHFRLDKTALSVGIIDFDVHGTVQRDTANRRTRVAVDFGLHASSLADLLAAIPPHIVDIKQMTVAGALDFSGQLDGYFGEAQWPLCTVSLQLKDGSVAGRRRPDKPFIQLANIDCEATIDMMRQQPSYVNVKTLYLQSPSAKLSVSGLLGSLFERPFIDARIHGDIDFDRFWQHAPFAKSFTLGGSVLMDVAGRCYLGDLLASDYGKINASGEVDVRNAIFKAPQEGIDVFAPLAKIKLGSHVVDSFRGREIASLFRANVDMDSLKLQWQHTNTLHAGRLRATFRTSEPSDTASIAEMAAYVRLTHLQVATDSMRIRASKIMTAGRLSSMAGQPAKPEWSARLTVDSLRGRMPDFFGRVNNAALTVHIHPHEAPVRQRAYRQTEADSIRRRLFRDSLARINRNTTAVAFRLSEGKMRDFLAQWDMSGTFTSTDCRLRTPYFPLRTRISESAFTFTNDQLSVTAARLQTGASDVRLSGEIEGLRRALLRNGRLTANMTLTADSIQCNEIIRALAAGSDYIGKSATHRDSIARLVLDESVELPPPDDSLPGLLVVPRNLDVAFKANLKNITYGRFHINQADGDIVMRSQSIRIPNLQVTSDVGHIELSLVYKAPTTKSAYTGVDMHMQRVHIRELIRSIPMLDSLTPMLRSFEGEAECTITAVTELDSLSNVVIPKTTASCYINGKNMVLLDGKTFSSIAQKLYFKNKERNMIDSIAVELVLEDGKIMVFPFVVSIDRYQAAIGGTQNLDLSFRYHISILKWPIPLVKIGLNLWGTPDDIHYGLAGRKYANLHKPVKEQSLESTVINMRQQLHASLRQSIDDILNESPATFRQPRMAMTDRERDTVFALDTTAVVMNNEPEGKE